MRVESRTGAVVQAIRHHPVSRPRSSNAACGFPALRSPTGFISHLSAARQCASGVAGARPAFQRPQGPRTAVCLAWAPYGAASGSREPPRRHGGPPLRASHQNPHHRAHPVHLRRAPPMCRPVAGRAWRPRSAGHRLHVRSQPRGEAQADAANAVGLVPRAMPLAGPGRSPDLTSLPRFPGPDTDMRSLTSGVPFRLGAELTV